MAQRTIATITMITGLNHITLAVRDIDISFKFYRDILGFTPLCKWEGSAYFLIGQPEDPHALWFCLDRNPKRESSSCSTHYAFSVSLDHFDALSKRVVESGAQIYQPNTTPGKSLYFLDPDAHKLEIHIGNWQDRLKAKKDNPGNWKNIEWFL
jgi:catechol 2,3-dioxygenase-like lactoylglutathione lyase family enzyme